MQTLPTTQTVLVFRRIKSPKILFDHNILSVNFYRIQNRLKNTLINYRVKQFFNILERGKRIKSDIHANFFCKKYNNLF